MNESLSRRKKGPFIACVEQPFAACCLITDKINKTYQGTLAQHAAAAAPPHSELLLEPVPGAGARVLAQPVLEHAHPVPLVQGRPLPVLRVPHPHSSSAHCSLSTRLERSHISFQPSLSFVFRFLPFVQFLLHPHLITCPHHSTSSNITSYKPPPCCHVSCVQVMRAAWCEAELVTTAASSLPRQTEPTAPGGLGWAAPPGHCLGAAPHTATLLPLLRNSSTLHDSQIHLHVSKTSSFERPNITHQKLHCQCW